MPTDDGFIMDGTETMTYRQFINSFLKYRDGDSVELKLAYYLGKDVDSEEMRLLEWAGLFSDEVIGLRRATPARVLEHLFKRRWAMQPDDRDMIVMWHLFEYELDGRSHRLESSMVAIGEDTRRTAMARTVGLPLAIAARERLTDGLPLNGVHRPLMRRSTTRCSISWRPRGSCSASASRRFNPPTPRRRIRRGSRS